MMLAVRLGGTYRPVTVKSTALIFAVAVFAILIISVLYELFGRKGTVCYIIAVFCLIVTADSLLFPVEEVYYRYTSLAAVLAVCLASVPLILGKHDRDCIKPFELKLSHENVFLAAALIAGSVLALCLPISSYNTWDDENHYERALYMSQGIYATETEADIDLIFSPSVKPGSEDQAAFSKRLDAEEKNPGKVIAYNDARAFFPDRISYIGTVAFMWLGRVLGLSFSARYILGRFGNLLLYCLIMYFAIRRLKTGKTVLTVLALCPAVIITASSYSCDPWIFALSALSFSYFFSIAERKDRKITVRETVIMTGAMVLAVLPKLPYTFLLVFLLLMPRDRFESKKQYANYWILIIACGITLFLLTFLSTFGTGDVADARFADEPVSAVGQLQYILSDMGGFLRMLWAFMVSYLAPANVAGSLVQMGIITEGALGTMFLSAVLFAAFVDGPANRPAIRILGTLICLLMAVLLAWVFYLVFTPVGKNYILGCQGRYLIPMLFPASVLVLGGYFRPRNIWFKAVPVLAGTVILALSIAKVFI